MRAGFWGLKGDLNVEVLKGASYPRHLTLMNLGILTSLGYMPSCRQSFKYAQKTTGLPPLLEPAGVGGLLITIVLPGECEQTGLDTIRKDRDCITLFTKVFGFLCKGNLTK